MKVLWCIGVLLVALAGVVPAQDLLWRVTGVPASSPTGGRHLGNRTTALGDIDRDGYEDVLTIVEGRCTAAQGYQGYLWILSGANGTLIREDMNPLPFWSRSITATGDMNADGIADYATGLIDNSINQNHRVEVRSGADGSVLWWVPVPFWPDEVLSELDVNGDGLKDLVVGSSNSGQANVYSHGGQLMYQLLGSTSNPPLLIAECFTRLNDIDNDGADDFVMGCYEPMARGANVIVSGRTGAYIRICYGLPGDVLNFWVDNCGDLDLDGYDDFAAANGSLTSVTLSAMRVFSSRTGQILRSWVSPSPGIGFSPIISSRGVDLDGDGVPDFIHGTTEPVSAQQSGAVYAWSGRDSSLLHRLVSLPPFGYIGSGGITLHAPVGGHTGSFVVIDYQSDPWGAPGCAYELGSLTAYSGIPRTARILGPACSGSLTASPNIGMQALGTNGVRVELSRAPAGTPAVLLLGLSTTQIFGMPLPLPVDVFGFPGCFLRTSIEAQFLAVTGTTGIGSGFVGLDLPHPIPASGLGIMSLSGQWVVLGMGNEFPGGLTQAVTWRR